MTLFLSQRTCQLITIEYKSLPEESMVRQKWPHGNITIYDSIFRIVGSEKINH